MYLGPLVILLPLIARGFVLDGTGSSPGTTAGLNGGWTTWSGWSSCAGYCGVSKLKTRTRTCTDPSRGCIGNTKEYDICDPSTCQPIRLVNGPHMYAGRIEVFHNGQWGTVCDDGFGAEGNGNAWVVCGMLSLPWTVVNTTSYLNGYFGREYALPILLDDVLCSGSENSIVDCSHNKWGVNNCGHDEDVGVSCLPDLSIRLSGGTDSQSGRVELSIDGNNWGTVCSHTFTDNNNGAEVVCRMLGYPSANATYSTNVSAGTGSTFLNNVNCTGSEDSLMMCGHDGWGVANCAHSEDVGVTYLSIRLSGGTDSQSGRVELSIDGNNWGTVCSHTFTDNNNGAEVVVCRMLGYPSANATYSTTVSAGTGSTFLNNVNCTGSEDSLMMCGHDGWGVANCAHSEDVGVTCA